MSVVLNAAGVIATFVRRQRALKNLARNWSTEKHNPNGAVRVDELLVGMTESKKQLGEYKVALAQISEDHPDFAAAKAILDHYPMAEKELGECGMVLTVMVNDIDDLRVVDAAETSTVVA